MRRFHRCQSDVISTACAILLNSIEKDVNFRQDYIKKKERKKKDRKKKEIKKKYLQDPAGGGGWELKNKQEGQEALNRSPEYTDQKTSI